MVGVGDTDVVDVDFFAEPSHCIGIRMNDQFSLAIQLPRGSWRGTH